jgi:hypothetical protein
MMTALLISGCGGGVKGGEPAASVASPAPAAGPQGAAPPATGAPDAGPAAGPDAGPAAGPCDPSIDAAHGTTVSDSGACPGVMPAAPACAGDLLLCGGTTSSSLGVSGNFASAAAIDGLSGLALACTAADNSATFYNLYLPMPSGFVSRAPLGAGAWATQDGFVTVGRSTGPSPMVFRAQDGSELSSAPAASRIFVGERSILAVRAAQQGSDVLLTAQGYATTGAPLLDAQPVATLTGASSGSLMLGGAATAGGSTLLIWQIYGQSGASARWLAADGTAPGAAFALQGWTSGIPDAAALADGGVALSTGTAWRGVVAAGAASETPAPQWLASRGPVQLFPGGRAMLFGIEVLAPDGTRCGTLDLGAPVLGIGNSGTVVTARDQRTFRIYPQLLR